jgi:hypothetical protein
VNLPLLRRIADASCLFDLDWESNGMDDTKPEPDDIAPAGVNRRTDGEAQTAPSLRLANVILSLARLIGRQIAREQFEALQAANDNRPRLVAEAEQQDWEGEKEVETGD